MASLHFAKEKAEKSLAIKCLEDSIANWLERYKFHVKASTDDGGPVLEVLIEVEDPSSPLREQEKNVPKFEEVWMGWRLIITKIPIGYIKVFYPK